MTGKPRIQRSVLERIGDTPLVELRTIVPEDCARILLKVEAENPSGSIKDRQALAMIEAAERDGRLEEGGRVVEYTGGSTGVSLAMICAVKGYPLDIITSDAFSVEKRTHMAALGAKLTIVPSVGGGLDATLTRSMIRAANEISDSTGAYLTDQLSNPDQIPAYHAMGEEIWEQTGGRIDAFAHMAGTSASVRGVSEALHRRDPSIHCVAIEPSESAVLSGGETGAHRIEGVGAGFVVPLWERDAVDDVAVVSTDVAMAMARRLAVEEGVLAGTSTGGNVAIALDLGRRLGRGATVVTLWCDSGIKYLSTELYAGAVESARLWSGPGD